MTTYIICSELEQARKERQSIEQSRIEELHHEESKVISRISSQIGSVNSQAEPNVIGNADDVVVGNGMSVYSNSSF